MRFLTAISVELMIKRRNEIARIARIIPDYRSQIFHKVV